MSTTRDTISLQYIEDGRYSPEVGHVLESLEKVEAAAVHGVLKGGPSQICTWGHRSDDLSKVTIFCNVVGNGCSAGLEAEKLDAAVERWEIVACGFKHSSACEKAIDLAVQSVKQSARAVRPVPCKGAIQQPAVHSPAADGPSATAVPSFARKSEDAMKAESSSRGEVAVPSPGSFTTQATQKHRFVWSAHGFVWCSPPAVLRTAGAVKEEVNGRANPLYRQQMVTRKNADRGSRRTSLRTPPQSLRGTATREAARVAKNLLRDREIGQIWQSPRAPAIRCPAPKSPLKPPPHLKQALLPTTFGCRGKPSPAASSSRERYLKRKVDSVAEQPNAQGRASTSGQSTVSPDSKRKRSCSEEDVIFVTNASSSAPTAAATAPATAAPALGNDRALATLDGFSPATVARLRMSGVATIKDLLSRDVGKTEVGKLVLYLGTHPPPIIEAGIVQAFDEIEEWVAGEWLETRFPADEEAAEAAEATTKLSELTHFPRRVADHLEAFRMGSLSEIAKRKIRRDEVKKVLRLLRTACKPSAADTEDIIGAWQAQEAFTASLAEQPPVNA